MKGKKTKEKEMTRKEVKGVSGTEEYPCQSSEGDKGERSAFGDMKLMYRRRERGTRDARMARHSNSLVVFRLSFFFVIILSSLSFLSFFLLIADFFLSYLSLSCLHFSFSIFHLTSLKLIVFFSSIFLVFRSSPISSFVFHTIAKFYNFANLLCV